MSEALNQKANFIYEDESASDDQECSIEGQLRLQVISKNENENFKNIKKRSIRQKTCVEKENDSKSQNVIQIPKQKNGYIKSKQRERKNSVNSCQQKFKTKANEKHISDQNKFSRKHNNSTRDILIKQSIKHNDIINQSKNHNQSYQEQEQEQEQEQKTENIIQVQPKVQQPNKKQPKKQQKIPYRKNIPYNVQKTQQLNNQKYQNNININSRVTAVTQNEPQRQPYHKPASTCNQNNKRYKSSSDVNLNNNGLKACGCPKIKSKKQKIRKRPLSLIIGPSSDSQQESPPVPQIITNQLLEYRLNNFVQQIVHKRIKKNVVMRSIIHIDKSGFNYFWPEFKMFLRYNQAQILSAKKSAFKLCSKYKIYTQSVEDDKICVGKVQSNYSGDIFNIYQSLNQQTFHMIASVIYNNVINPGTPESFQVYYLDKIYDELIDHEHPEIIIDSLKQLITHQKFGSLIKVAKMREPVWNSNLRSYVNDFKKRAPMGSSKNFILQNKVTGKEMLMLGKISEDMFNFQVSYPLNPIIAMGIMLTKFEQKMLS